jgi:hypothetical protein
MKDEGTLLSNGNVLYLDSKDKLHDFMYLSNFMFDIQVKG